MRDAGRHQSNESYSTIILQAPDVEQILADEKAMANEPEPYRIGEAIISDIDLIRDGTWTDVGGGKKILRLGVRSEEAKGLVLYYSLLHP